MIISRGRGGCLTEAVVNSPKLWHHLNSACGSFIEGVFFNSDIILCFAYEWL